MSNGLKKRTLGAGLALIATIWVAPDAPAATANSVDFQRDIQPIFASRCLECHGEQKQKSGIRLDRKSGAFNAADSGKPAVVPGNVAESSLIQRITSTNPDEVMPPKGDRLSSQQVELLKRWVEQGAPWPETGIV